MVVNDVRDRNISYMIKLQSNRILPLEPIAAIPVFSVNTQNSNHFYNKNCHLQVKVILLAHLYESTERYCCHFVARLYESTERYCCHFVARLYESTERYCCHFVARLYESTERYCCHFVARLYESTERYCCHFVVGVSVSVCLAL